MSALPSNLDVLRERRNASVEMVAITGAALTALSTLETGDHDDPKITFIKQAMQDAAMKVYEIAKADSERINSYERLTNTKSKEHAEYEFLKSRLAYNADLHLVDTDEMVNELLRRGVAKIAIRRMLPSARGMLAA